MIRWKSNQPINLFVCVSACCVCVFRCSFCPPNERDFNFYLNNFRLLNHFHVILEAISQRRQLMWCVTDTIINRSISIVARTLLLLQTFIVKFIWFWFSIMDITHLDYMVYRNTEYFYRRANGEPLSTRRYLLNLFYYANIIKLIIHLWVIEWVVSRTIQQNKTF